MKKFSLFLAAMLMLSFSFAQISTTKKVAMKDGSSIQIKGKPAKASAQQKAFGQYWFNLIDDANLYFGLEPDGFGPIVQCDPNGLYNFSDGLSVCQFFSVGQVYDWTHASWNEMYSYTGAPENVPYLATANSYSIDSIQMPFQYVRGTNVAADVVDTIAISYIVNIDPDNDVFRLGSGSNYYFIMPFLPFDNTTFMARLTSMDPSLNFSHDLNANAAIYYDKIPLTANDDTGDEYFYYLTLETPEALHNISTKSLAVDVTFIPGNERNATSEIGVDLSKFRTILFDDPREGYDDWGSPELLEDYQIGLFHSVDNFSSDSLWYNVYQPTLMWVGNPKPSISLLVTCNDCEIVNVPEIEKKNITVYPNPATNNFTVNMGNDEKASIQLFNIVGQQVYSETFTGTTTVNVANLHSGVYMLKVNQNGKVNTTKVIVK